MSVDKTRLDNRIYQTSRSDDVSPAGSATRKYGGDQQIPTAIIILLADVFLAPGKLSAGDRESFRHKNRERSIIPPKFSGRG